MDCPAASPSSKPAEPSESAAATPPPRELELDTALSPAERCTCSSTALCRGGETIRRRVRSRSASVSDGGSMGRHGRRQRSSSLTAALSADKGGRTSADGGFPAKIQSDDAPSPWPIAMSSPQASTMCGATRAMGAPQRSSKARARSASMRFPIFCRRGEPGSSSFLAASLTAFVAASSSPKARVRATLLWSPRRPAAVHGTGCPVRAGTDTSR